MDIEYLKIEPPNVVKDELEIDQCQNFEVKLENEEKPQTMGEDFTCEENKPSTSTIVKEKLDMIMSENYETKLKAEEKPQIMEEVIEKKPLSFKTGGFEFEDMKLYKCFHCGYRKALMEMVKTPETEKEIIKWSNILGKKFCENFTIRSPICRSHFIDKFGDSRLIDVVRGNKIVETKIGDRFKCCYCGNSRMARSMTRVPKDEYTFVEWAKILGKHFQDQFGKRKYGFICRTHFNTEWEGQRPEHLLPVAVEKKLKQNMNTDLDENITETMLAEKKIVCTYCEELKPSHEVKKISHQPNNLKTWRDILGEDFYKRALSQMPTYICLSHFDIEWQEQNRKLLLAKKDKDSGENVVIVPEGNISGSMFDEKRRTCVYCRTSKPRREMTLTPLNPNTLKQWADILGDEFYKKASSKQGTYICRSHFNINWVVPRPKYVLPVDDLNKCKQKLDIVPDRSITGTNLAEKEVKKHRRPQSPFPCSESVLFNQDKSKTSTVQVDGNIERSNPYTILSTCAYCGETKPYRVLTMVPRDPLVLKKWSDVLGEEFYRRAQGNVFTSICRSHFDVGWVNIRPCNLLPHAEHVRGSLHQVKHTDKESPFTKINLALKSSEDTLSSENVKLEETNVDENPDKKPLLLLDEYIKPEAQNQEFEIEAELENKLEVPSSNERTNQDGSLNTKRIKLEVKEEKSDN